MKPPAPLERRGWSVRVPLVAGAVWAVGLVYNVVFHRWGIAALFAVNLAFQCAAYVLQVVELAALGGGRVFLRRRWRSTELDLTRGFELKPNWWPRSQRLAVNRKRFGLIGLGTFPEVDEWLREAQVAV